ncbi:hypothetical protein [Pseudomonas orientalis]|uniref:hypothetical protein n=1 Tax=Pseudomonas orientalis TaxID=76758 RepID=UPI001F1522E0|nr:hypothetical protein [Pseudomonas orientalis]
MESNKVGMNMTNGITPGFGIPFIPNQGPAPASGGYTRLSVVDKAIGTQQPLGTAFGFASSLPGVNAANPHFDAQRLYGGASKVGNTYTSSPDNILATALQNSFFLLIEALKKDPSAPDKSKEEKRYLTQEELKYIDSEGRQTGLYSESNVMLANEIINRPRLNEAIRVDGGKITSESLAEAAKLLTGNTSPNTQSADPFHSSSNYQVVTEFRGMFDQLMDESKTFSWPWDKHRFVKTDTLVEMSKDPDELDSKGNVVRDPANGFPKKKYSERQVYLAKNIIERPGLLDSLDSYKANGYAFTGSRNNDGWLKNYSIDRWLENDKKEKGN